MVDAIISFQVKELPGLRDAGGRYTAAVSKQRPYNRNLALVIQSRVVAQMRTKISSGKRAGASTNRLLSTTASEGNLAVGNLSAGVGVPRFLDASQAKYWRTFEEGSAAVWSRPFIGTQLIPVGPGRGKSRWMGHGEFPGARTTKKDVPFLNGKYIVKREIAPAAIYRQVAREMEPELTEAGIQAGVRLLNYVLGQPVRR